MSEPPPPGLELAAVKDLLGAARPVEQQDPAVARALGQQPVEDRAQRRQPQAAGDDHDVPARGLGHWPAHAEWAAHAERGAALSAASAAETGPTARIVWMRRSESAGSPVRLIGTSPMPKAVSMLNWPGTNPVAAGALPTPSRASSTSRAVTAATRARGRCAAPSGPRASVAASGRVAMAAVDIEDLQPRRLQALDRAPA